MAKKLIAYNWGSGKGTKKYPWRRWMNGGIWKVTKDEDYDCATSSFVVYLHTKAREEKLQVRTRTERDADGEAVVFQFWTP